MAVDLYYYPMSAPCRAVTLTAEAIGLPLNLIHLDLFAGEQMTPEYEELNPQKLVPFLVDGDYKLAESRAIVTYLVDQYGKNPRLYPQSVTARALVNQRLYFDMFLFKAVIECYRPLMMVSNAEIDPELHKKTEAAFEVLNNILEGQDYVAGRHMTVADLCMAATVSTAEAFGFEVQNYWNVGKWLEKTASTAPGYRTANGEGLQMLKEHLQKVKEG